MSLQTNVLYEFANFRLDLSEKVLMRDGTPVPLTPKVFDTLEVLTENAGRLLEKDELMNRLWQDRFVEEGNLVFNIKMLRKALGDDAAKPRFIETVQRRGYRFIADVRQVEKTAPAIASPKVPDFPLPTQKPYVLISIAVISLISVFGIAFVWVGGNKLFHSRQAKFTRLTSSGKITNAAVAPDGKSIVFAQKEGVGESLYLRQIDSGSQRQILPPQDVEFIGLTVAPAGDYVYYSVFSKNSVVLTLMRIALAGEAGPEPLSDIATDTTVSFSPDGRKFAFTESHTSVREFDLKIADADGSNQRVLLKTRGENRMLPAYRASPTAWSPDGETIACAIQETDENGTFYKILLVDPVSGSEKYLSDKPWSLIENIVWKDADNLAFIEYELNSPVKHIWQISRKTGEMRQLTNDLNDYEWLSSAGGNLYTLQKSVFSSLHVAEYAENTSALQPKQIFGESSVIENVGWSREGRIFYNSRTSGKNEIWQINPDGTAPQQLTAGSNLTTSFTVSPVDNTLVFPSLQNGRIALSAADSSGQNLRPLTDGARDILPAFSPDGKTVVFQRGAAPPTLWSVAADGNQAPQQLTGYQATNPSVSPDGTRIAFHFMDYGSPNPHWKLGLIDSETRRLVNKLEFPIPVYQRKTVWHPKNELLTMVFSSGEGSGFLLWSLPDDKFQKIENIGAGEIGAFAWSPDGNRLVFAQNFATSDVVSLENF
jgi:DNA-binding winged helix-turn-helix (wHTH) protein/Tol biopolymer transport system component